MKLFGNLEKAADESRKFFIKNCIGFDTPRLADTVYPEGVKVESDLPYADGKALPPALAPDAVSEGYDLCCSDRTMDIYTPDDAKEKEIYLLIHGGAFVYGCKELDKEFGMHLALRSKTAVANINYRLMPRTDLSGVLTDIFYAISYLCEKGYTTFHTTGDSAGGYLCHLTAILLHSKNAREDFGITDFPYEVTCKSTSPICGASKNSRKQFAGIYFDPEKKLPECIFDLSEAVKKYGCPPVLLTTGDQDMMEKQNVWLHKRLTEMGVPVTYYCAVSTEDRPMHHVYAIAHPTWPEGIKTIELTIENATRKD